MSTMKTVLGTLDLDQFMDAVSRTEENSPAKQLLLQIDDFQHQEIKKLLESPIAGTSSNNLTIDWPKSPSTIRSLFHVKRMAQNPDPAWRTEHKPYSKITRNAHQLKSRSTFFQPANTFTFVSDEAARRTHPSYSENQKPIDYDDFAQNTLNVLNPFLHDMANSRQSNKR